MEFAMMGHDSHLQPKFFYYNISLEQRVPAHHILRKIKQRIDFDFIYAEVKDLYGDNGNVSVPPPVILKMMLLLILYNVRSERELMETIPLRLDWLWFLGFDLESEVPDHSVLSKARVRWGTKAFKGFFERIVWQCIEAGLVDGKRLFVDSSLIEAHASNNSVVDTEDFKRHIEKSYTLLEGRLDELEGEKPTPANSRYISTTDPDASVTRYGGGKSKLRYKTHRGVDPKREVITATTVTAGSSDDGVLLKKVIDTHECNTQKRIESVTGDSKYGTIANFLLCHDLGIKGHFPSLEETHRGSGRQERIFPKEAFSYHPENDTFTCPAGQMLRKRHYYEERQHYEYKASSHICARCQLVERCTRAKYGRTLKRHLRQNELEAMHKEAASEEARQDLKTRKHLSERSFAQSTRYGYKKARWRRLWRMEIQDFLIAAVQNIQIIIKNTTTGLAHKATGVIGNLKSTLRGRDIYLSSFPLSEFSL
jgi:transposase